MILHPAVIDVAARREKIDKALRSGTLTEKDTAAFMEDWARPYGDNTLSMGRAGSAELSGVKDFEDPYTIPFTVSVLEEDRDGDIVLPLGCQTHNFARNPVWFMGHQEWAIPIGVARNKRGDRLYVWPEENRVRAACRFDDGDPDAMFIHGKVERGMLNATSIAFVPIEAHRREDIEKARTHHQHTAAPLGWVFRTFDLTEISVVGVPSCAGAIRDSLDQEKSFISPRLQKGLSVYAAQAKGCWNGWCPCCPIEDREEKESSKIVEKSSTKTKEHTCGCDNCQKGKECPCHKHKEYEEKSVVTKRVKVIPWNTGFSVSRETENKPLMEGVRFDTEQEAEKWARSQGFTLVKVRKSIQRKYIRHQDGKWIVHAESGKVLGKHDTKEDAERQLRAIEANKHRNKAKRTSKPIKMRQGGDRIVVLRSNGGQYVIQYNLAFGMIHLGSKDEAIRSARMTLTDAVDVLKTLNRYPRPQGQLYAELLDDKEQEVKSLVQADIEPPTPRPSVNPPPGTRSEGSTKALSGEEQAWLERVQRLVERELGRGALEVVPISELMNWRKRDRLTPEQAFQRVMHDYHGEDDEGNDPTAHKSAGKFSQGGAMTDKEIKDVLRGMATSTEIDVNGHKVFRLNANSYIIDSHKWGGSSRYSINPAIDLIQNRKSDSTSVSKTSSSSFQQYRVTQDVMGGRKRYWVEDSTHPGSASGPFASREEAQARADEMNSRQSKSKSLSQTSGVTGGYISPQETTTLGIKVCTLCSGSGNCPLCAGLGEIAGGLCEDCMGSGDCPDCSGVGKIEGEGLTALKEKSMKKRHSKQYDEEEAQPDTEQGMEDEEMNEEEEEDQEEEEVVEEEPAFIPPSAKVIAGLHGHAQAESDYLQDELGRMDNPQVKEALQNYHDEHVTPRMEHLKGVLEEHHPDHDLEGVMKALETDSSVTGGETTPGEAGEVGAGNVPPNSEEKAEVGSEEWQEEEEEEEPEHREEGNGVTEDSDTQEILERYQHPKTGQWMTRKVGKIRKTKDGKVFLVRAKSLKKKDFEDMRDEEDEERKCGGLYKGLPDDEEQHFDTMKAAVSEAGEFMDDMQDDDEIPKRYKSVLKHHSSRLGYVSKALTSMGKIQRNGGPGSPLTDEGSAGNKKPLTDKGELQRNGGKVAKMVGDRFESFAKRMQQMTGVIIDGVN